MAKEKEYTIVSDFKYGYRNLEDVTNLPPGVLVVGSQNVITNVSDRVQIRQGYRLDGLVNYVDAPVLSSFDWLTRGNGEVHMRAGRLSTTNNGLLQYRYVAEGGEYGDNLITNGTFTGNATGWESYHGAVSNGVLPSGNWAYNSNNIIHSAGSTNAVGQQAIPSPITPYHVHFVVGGSTGNVSFMLNDATFGPYAAGSTVNADFTSGSFGTAYDGLFLILPTSNFNSTIDNVSVQQILQEDEPFWKNLLTDLTTVRYNFTTFWKTDENLRVTLFVNGTPNIFEWDGASTVLLSTTSSTITKTGTPTTWSDEGFYAKTYSTVGSSTTQFDITNPAGSTYRYTFDGTGTDPGISAATFPIGSYVLIGAQNFSAANNGFFIVTGVGTNYFEVTNASGVVESNKTIGSGYIYNQYTKVVDINGVKYSYTGGENTITLTGVLPDPTGAINGSIVQQAVVTTPNSAMSGIPATFPNGLISVMNNQIYVGALTSSAMYLSAVSNYTNYSPSAPRIVGEGGSLILDQNLVAFIVQGNPTNPTMYVSTADIWYTILFTNATNVDGSLYQTLGAAPIKNGKQQGAQSQAFVSTMKNNTITVTGEPTVDAIGVMEDFFTQIQTKNLSDSIKLDVDQYDFTDGSIAYWRYYILVAVPQEGIVRIYNLNTSNWEAPQTLPISRFYIVDGELYGHSYSTFESYQLFTGYADRADVGFTGFPIQAIWKFSFMNYGSRFSFKKATKMYVEGYINANTTLTTALIYELDGCQTIKTFQLSGEDAQFVCVNASPGSLGKVSLGKQKIGGDQPDSIQGLPPKFRWFPTFSNTDFFEHSVQFSVLGIDERMELLAFGLAVSGSSEIPVQNMD